MAYQIASERIVPADAARHAGKRAICVVLEDGRRAWGFDDDRERALRNALSNATAISI